MKSAVTTRGRLEGRARPFVFVNMAMTADGKIATANRAVTSFGSRRDQRHLLELRARADAVMCGARTVATEGITLGPGPAGFRRLRLKHGLEEYNLRVVVSGTASIPPDADVFKHRFSPVLVLATSQAPGCRIEALRKVADEVKCFGQKEVDLEAALIWLRKRWKVRRLLCEGGGELNDALFRAGLVDELHLTLCPHLIGGRDAPTIADGRGFRTLILAAQLKLKSMKRIGDELYLVFAS